MPNPIEKLQNNIIAIHGEHGTHWWQHLPILLQQLGDQLHITLGTPFADLSFHYVAPAIGPQGEQWVLKCGVPSDRLRHEVQALRHYQRYGTVALINTNEAAGWLLTQRCTPGTAMIHNHQEQNTIPIAITVMQQLWHNLTNPQDFKQVSHWLNKLDSLHHSAWVKQHVPTTLQTFARGHAITLLQQTYKPVLLHGDLHYQNILRHQDQWLAIDPKGIIGPREFGVASFVRNPYCVQQDTTQECHAIARNIDQILELTQFDRQTVISWAIVQAVLWAYWYLEVGLLTKILP